jgi:hypothetical protein
MGVADPQSPNHPRDALSCVRNLTRRQHNNRAIAGPDPQITATDLSDDPV